MHLQRGVSVLLSAYSVRVVHRVTDPIGAVLDLAFTETAHWPTSEANDNKGANTGDNANNQDNDASLQSCKCCLVFVF